MSDSLEPRQFDGVEGRRHRRWLVEIKTVAVVGIRSVDCTILDLSPSGALIEFLVDLPVRVGDQMRIEMFEFGWLDMVARFVQGRRVGVQFIFDEQGEVEFTRFMVSMRNIRRPPRHEVAWAAELRVGVLAFACEVENISPNGASVTLPRVPEFDKGENVTLALPGQEPIDASVGRIDGLSCGLMFLVRFDGDLS